MTTQEIADRVKSELLEWLKGTPYASTLLEPLPGGSANFVYRAKLSKSLEDGTTDVLVKHGEGFMALYPQNNLSTDRCQIEEECLKALVSFRINNADQFNNTFKYVVKTPNCYLFDDATNTQIQEYFHNGIDLKSYVLKYFPSPTPVALRPQCYELGKGLAQYITGFHRRAEESANHPSQPRGAEGETGFLHQKLQSNEAMQALKHMINYDWLLERVDQFPHILTGAKEVFAEVKAEALAELKRKPEALSCIHGDFWPGKQVLPPQTTRLNPRHILLPNKPLQQGIEIPILVIDWENAQLGLRSQDHGEMMGEMYALWLYDRIDAGIWMLQGYTAGLGDEQQTAASAWHIAAQVGVHLLSFCTLGRGTTEQSERVARLGRDTILKARRRDWEWFERGELGCLFTGIRRDGDGSGERAAV